MLPALSVDSACSMCSNFSRGYASIVGDDVHWFPIDWNMYDVSLALVPSSIICSLRDVVHDNLNVGYGSIEGQLERSLLSHRW